MSVISIIVGVLAGIYGTIGGHSWAIAVAVVAMAGGVRRLTGEHGSDELELARRRGTVLVDMPWKRAAWATALLAVVASVEIDRHDPAVTSTVLWISAIVAAIVTGVVHDRDAGVWRPLAAAVSWRRIDTIAVVALTVTAFAIRMHRLDALLPAMHGDEGEMGLLARLALDGPATPDAPSLPLFDTAFLDHPTLFHHVQAIALWTFGDSITGLRVLSVIFGAACVAPVYLIGRLGWGRIAATVAAWLLVVSHLHVHFSRIALNNIQSAWFVATAVALVMGLVTHGRATRDRGEPLQPSMTMLVLLGVTIGLSQYFYYGARMLVVIAVPTLVVLVRDRLARLRDALTVLAGALVPALPLLRLYLDDVPAFVNRTRGVSVFNATGIQLALGPDARWPGDLPELVSLQVRRNLDFFFRSGDRSSFYTPEFPAFDSTTVLLFWLGLGVVVAQALRRRPAASPAAKVVGLWLVAGVLLGGVLTNDAPNSPRLLMVVPAVFVVGGVAVQFVHDTVGGMSSERVRRVVLGAAVLLALVTGTSNWQRYFDDYPRVQRTGWVVELGELMAASPPSQQIYLIGDPVLSVGYGTIRFLADGGSQLDLFTVEEFQERYEVDTRDGRDVLVIALAHRTGDLDRIVASYPGGTIDEHLGAAGELLWRSYALPAR